MNPGDKQTDTVASQTNLLAKRQHIAHMMHASEYLLVLVYHLWPDH